MKNCLTCKTKMIQNLESEVENEIPQWYKKMGNYSLLPRMLNCNDKYNANKNKFRRVIPNITDNEIKIDIKSTKNTWIYYWAAEPQKNRLEISDPIKAYSDQNYGLVKTNSSGNVTLILNCPQPYKVDDITYPRHVHYVCLKSDKTWDNKVKTVVVFCHIDKDGLEEILELNTHFVINALPKENYDKEHIPKSLSFPLNELKDKNKEKQILSFIKKI